MLTLDKSEEVYRNRLALMNELKERVLAVSAWLSKVYLAYRIVDFNAVT
jgi:hypothetical protein